MSVRRSLPRFATLQRHFAFSDENLHGRKWHDQWCFWTRHLRLSSCPIIDEARLRIIVGRPQYGSRAVLLLPAPIKTVFCAQHLRPLTAAERK